MLGSAPAKSDASPEFKAYFDSVGGVPLLTADDERRLAAAIARGEEDARSRLITANLRLVIHIARDYRGRGLSLDDLIGEGNLGLIRAAKEFDASYGVRFSTYASYWIKQAIRQALIDAAPTIRVPGHMVNLQNKWRRAERELARELGREPSSGEVADRLGLSARQREMVEDARRAGRMASEGSTGGRDESWAAADVVDASEGPEAGPEAEEERAGLLRRVAALDERERTVLAHRYGLGGADRLTLGEIGDRLGCTREWARKLEIRAVRKLAEASAAR